MSEGLHKTPLTTGEMSPVIQHELQRLKSHWWWFLILGVLLVIGGIIALAYPFVSSVGIILVFGAILIIGGIATVIGAFWAGKWSGFLLQLLVGVLYVMAGMVIRDTPLESVALLTLFIAGAFVVVGVFRIVAALVEKFPQWGWALFNGVVTMVAGLIIYDTYPTSALWLIGLIVGLELLFNGWTWIMLSYSIRSLPAEEGVSSET